MTIASEPNRAPGATVLAPGLTDPPLDRRAAPPIRAVRLGPSEVVVEHRAAATYLRSPHPLAAYPNKLTERLEHWARCTPDCTFIAERDVAGDWRELTYAQTLNLVRRVGQALIDRGLSSDRPLVILSGNDIEHAILGLAALYVGIAYAPISPAYSIISEDLGKLRQIIDLLTPGLVFAADGSHFGRALETVIAPHIDVAVTRKGTLQRSVTPFSELADTSATSAVDAAHHAVQLDTIAKFLFTSGSTGAPKAVINTQRMLCSNQAMIRAAMAFMQDEPPVVLDWSPWHHTAGGNHNVGLVLYNGGTFYIDEGKPTPAGIATTIRNLRDIAPTWYFNVPKGFDALVSHLRVDPLLRQNFFSRLRILFYAGAGMSRPVWDEMQQLAVDTCGERILFLTSLGATETAPMAIVCTREVDRPGHIGVPAPGVELKLVACEDKLEARLRGPNITPGYWRQDHLTAGAFDEEGFYRLGDALKFVDPSDPGRGLLFDGRLAEDFKLATGTWVRVGPLRARCIDGCAPYVRDVVFAGHDRDQVSALIFPDLEACRSVAPELPEDAPPDVVFSHLKVRAKVAELLSAIDRNTTGSSNRISRAVLLVDPPSIDRGEITDKGTINQRAVLKHRAAVVEELYTVPASPRLIVLGPEV